MERNMKKDIESADHVAKITLAGAVIVSYFFDLIRGPSAVILLVLAILVVLAFIVRIAYKWITMD